MNDYHINIFYSEEDEGYIADFPDLVHCSAFGVSPEEALHEAIKAKEVWIETAKSKNKPIPAATYKPALCSYLILKKPWTRLLFVVI